MRGAVQLAPVPTAGEMRSVAAAREGHQLRRHRPTRQAVCHFQVAGRLHDCLTGVGVMRERGRFVAGESGNPRGRPSVMQAVRDVAQMYSVEAVALLVQLMQDRATPPSARVRAATTVIQWGMGRAARAPEQTEVAVLADAELQAGVLPTEAVEVAVHALVGAVPRG